MSTPAFKPGRPQLRIVPPPKEKEPAPSSSRLPAPTLDDTELLRAMREGDPSAATALHDRLRPVVDRTIRRLLGPGDRDQEDLAQNAMIEIVMTVDRFRGECPLDGWASTVTAHVVYNQLRRRTTERRIFDSIRFEVLDQVPASQDLSRQTAARSALSRIVHHLSHIDELKAWAYILHDVCGYDLQEVSKIMSCTVSAAQTRLVRGRRELEERVVNDPELGDASWGAPYSRRESHRGES